tara:strand:+ start:626 stop:1543 length:918 start_codon:yes stop_codon:yes gene_type:complete
MTKVNFSKLPEADVLLTAIKERSKKGLNSNIFVIGLSGTGKSSTSIRVAELLEEKRKEEEETIPQIFIIDSLLELIKSLRKSKEGDIIISEEVSVLFSSRRAMAGDNVSIGKVMDTCRKKQLTIISNAPIWGSIDSHLRGMGHFLIETLRINKTQKVVVSKFHRLQTNPSSGKTYRHTMQRDGRDVSRMFTKMPSSNTWNDYENQKDKFMDELYERLQNEQEKKQEKFQKDLSKKNTSIRDLSQRELQVHQLFFRQNKTRKEIAEGFGISPQRVGRIIKSIVEKSKNEKSEKEKTVSKDSGADIK